MFIFMFCLILGTTLISWFLEKIAKEEMPDNLADKYPPEDMDRAWHDFLQMYPNSQITRQQFVEFMDIIREHGVTKKTRDIIDAYFGNIAHDSVNQQQHLSSVVTTAPKINLFDYISETTLVTGLEITFFFLVALLLFLIFRDAFKPQ